MRNKINWKVLSGDPKIKSILILKSNIDRIYWPTLSRNPNPLAIQIMKDNLDIFKQKMTPFDWCYFFESSISIHFLDLLSDKIHKSGISGNEHPKAIKFLESNQDKIYWPTLSKNPAAIDILKANQDKIVWDNLSENPAAIELLIQNQDKINWFNLIKNPNPLIHNIVKVRK